MCFGSVGSTGGRGPKTGEAGWCSGEWKVGGYPAKDARRRVGSATVYCPVCRLACRDIGGSDPERMAAPRVAEYVEELFRNSPVQVEPRFVCNNNCHLVPRTLE